MMKISLSILSCILLSFFSINCNAIYYKGYIIKTNGDTLFGKIKFTSVKALENKVIFKTSYTIIDYVPTDDIKGYFVEPNYYFEVHQVPSEEMQPKKYFLQVLVKGKTNLYYFEGTEVGEVYYFEKDSAHFYTIQEPEILNNLLNSCYSLGKLEIKDFNKTHLANQIENYNQCFGNTKSGFLFHNMRSVSYHFNIGTTSNKSEISDYSIPFHNVWLNPSFGLQIDLLFKLRSSYRIIFQSGLGYTSYKSFIKDFSPYYTSVKMNGEVRSDCLNIPISLRYDLSRNPFSVYLLAGPEIGYLLKYKITTRSESTSYNTDYNSHLERLMIGFKAGVGIEFKIINKHYINSEVNYYIQPETSGLSPTLHNKGIIITAGYGF